MFVGTAAAQLSLDGADRLVEHLRGRRAPLPLAEAARCLFALRGAPSALVHQLVDEVVSTDPRLTWRSGREVALVEWEEISSLVDLPVEEAPYVVFDLETTGTKPGTSRIVEVGAVRMLGFEAVDRFERLVDPGVSVPDTITRITGLQSRDVRGAPRIDRVLPEFLEFAAGAVLVAHNASFDVGFVDAELSRLQGRRLAAPVLDTVMLARRLLQGRLPRMNLGTLAERFDTTVRPCHRALPDAEATAEVLAALLGLAQERGVRTVADAISLAGPAAGRSAGAARWRGTCRPGPASTSSATPPGASSTWARRLTCAPASAPTSPGLRSGGRSSMRCRRPTGWRRGRSAPSSRLRWSSSS